MNDHSASGLAVMRVQLFTHLQTMKPRRYERFQACEDEIISVQSMRAQFKRQLRALSETNRLELTLRLSNIDEALSLLHDQAMATLGHIDQTIDQIETFITHGEPVPDWALKEARDQPPPPRPSPPPPC